MPEEFVWAVTKALAIVFCSTVIVLFLAWIGTRRCFPDVDNVELEVEQKKDHRAENPKTKKRMAA
jgi:hypothetical protein